MALTLTSPAEIVIDPAKPLNALDGVAAGRLAELFKALSDPTRLRLLGVLLEGELCVSELATRLGLSQSAVSHQLRGLRQMRLVRVRRAGRQAFYALDDDHIADLFQRGLEHVRHG
jgi:DNA-binding transcriptional ArsR family regulator